MKIAVLILAHKNLEQLERLTDVLREDMEVFIHIDNRITIPSSFYNKEHVHITQKRYASYWGSYYAQLAILELIKDAYENGCDYYILISGQDLPLMKNTALLSFIEKNYNNYLYHFPLPRPDWKQNGGTDRMTLYWDTKYDPKNPLQKMAQFPLRVSFYLMRKLQLLSGLKRKVHFPLHCGSLWFNLKKDAIEYILSFIQQNESYIDRFKFTRCTDEVFFHTILLSFDYKEKDKIVNADLRYVDWETGPAYPRVLTIDDYEKCLNSGCLFARKFDDKTDSEVIYKLIETVK